MPRALTVKPALVPLARRAGFSVLEVIAVLVLLGVLAAIAGTIALRPSTAIVTEADLVAAHLRYTQARALADVAPWRLALVSTSSYQLGRVGDAVARIPSTNTTTRSLTGGVTFAGATEVRFDAWGRPTDSGGTPLGSDLVLTFSDGPTNRTVTVTAGTGLIR